MNDLYPPADAEESRAHILTRLRVLSDRYSAEQFGKMHRIIGEEFDTARTFEEQENKARHLLHGTRQLRDVGRLHPEQAQFLEDLISSYHGFICKQLGKENTIEVPPPPGERSPLTSASKRK